MTDDNAEAMLQYMLDENLIQTRVNRQSKEHQLEMVRING